MSGAPFLDDRLLELLADREVSGLSEAEQRELEALLAETPGADDGSMERAAVALMLASLGDGEAMPESVRERALGAIRGGGSGAGRAEGLRLTGERGSGPRVGVLAWSGWIAAAACLVIAGITVVNSQNARRAEGVASLSPEAVERFLAEAPDAKVAEWSPWDNPEVPGVEGRVVWSESAQTGYLTFRGLRPNDPTEEQYQLWIIDERGMDQRISGAIFDADPETGEVVVRIDPGIEVRNAAAFAVTIEQPEGVWVSDMSRRVVIAQLPQS